MGELLPRVDQDERLLVLWDIDESEDAMRTDFSKVTIFKSPAMEISRSLTTDELIRKAQDEGYGDFSKWSEIYK